MSQNKKLLEQRHLNRRQFLLGAGSSFLLLPPLFSLMSKQAAAQVMANTRRRSVIWYGLYGVDGPQLFPANQTDLTQQAGVHVYTKPLSAFTGQISRLIDADFVSMYPHMNLIQGLSLTGGAYAGHNIGILAGVHEAGGNRDPQYGQSADVIMERSSGVYKPGEVVQNKAIRLITGDADDTFSYFFEGGKRKGVDSIQGDTNLFNTLFKGFTSPGMGATPPADDKLIVDKVYADLKVLEGNSRISKEDKLILNRYISSVFELQLKVGAANTGPACVKPTLPLQALKEGNYYYLPENGWGIKDVGVMYDNYIQLIKLAFACDLTRVVTVGCTLWSNSPINKDSNGGLHHEAGGSEIQADRQKWHLKKFLNLGKELAATTDPFGGGTLLDNSSLLWTNEMGDWTTGHNILSMPVVMLGSCGGYFKTGNFIDYRQRPMKTVDGSAYYPGRPYKQLIQSIMTGMGVPKEEYMKHGDGKGFGQFETNINQFGKVVNGAYSAYAAEHNNPLAWVVK